MPSKKQLKPNLESLSAEELLNISKQELSKLSRKAFAIYCLHFREDNPIKVFEVVGRTQVHDQSGSNRSVYFAAITYNKAMEGFMDLKNLGEDYIYPSKEKVYTINRTGKGITVDVETRIFED